MSFNFPNSPTDGTLFSPSGGPTYIYNAASSVWLVQTGGSNAILSISDAPPGSPVAGQMWWESDSGGLYAYYSDPDSSQWVQINVASSTSTNLFGFTRPTTNGSFLWNAKSDNTGANIATLDNAGGLTLGGTLSVSGAITTVNGNIVAGGGGACIAGTYSATGATNGKNVFPSQIQSSTTVATGSNHQIFANPNGVVGNINTNGTTTNYVTTSDETLKDFIGPYDPAKAIDIIRRDPVRDWHWTTDGTYAVGWGAQTSYTISEDLASPPDESVEGSLWGMDQSKRTPYLWAALAWALDQIDSLEARVTALEAKP